jgi:hypothetical protein
MAGVMGSSGWLEVAQCGTSIQATGGRQTYRQAGELRLCEARRRPPAAARQSLTTPSLRPTRHTLAQQASSSSSSSSSSTELARRAAAGAAALTLSLGNLCLPALASEFDILGEPTPSSYIVDDASVLSKSTRSDLNKRLSFLEVRLIVCGGAGGGARAGAVWWCLLMRLSLHCCR